MTKIEGILAVLLVLMILFRVQQVGGLTKPDIAKEFEGVNSLFSPARNYLSGLIDQILPQPESPLLSGILLGIQRDLPSELKLSLIKTSTIHIAVVSGQNLTLLAGFILNLASLLGRRKTLFLTFGLVIVYCFLTGFQLPVVRALIMIIFSFVAQLYGREGQGGRILLLTTMLMLIYNPNWLLSTSFQLSVLATFGVVVVAPILLNHLNLIPNLLKQDLAVSIAAQVLTGPIIAYNFHQMSLIGIVTNSLILWTIVPISIGGILAILLALIHPNLGFLAGLLPGVLLTFFIDMVQFFAKLPGASVAIPKLGIFFWLGYYLLVGAGVWMLHKRQTIASREKWYH